MRNKDRWTLSAFGLVLVILLSFLPTHTHAQIVPGWDFSVSGFGGGAIPLETDPGLISAPVPIVSPPVLGGATFRGVLKQVELNSSISFGGKVGAWTSYFRSATGLDFGVEIDVTHFTPDADRQTVVADGGFTIGGVGSRAVIPVTFPKMDIDATIVAANFLARLPLYQSPSFPNGLLQFYAGAGAGAEIADLEIAGLGSDGDTKFAFQLLAGAKVLLTKNVGLFVEYKFTHGNHAWHIQGTQIEFDLDVNHVVGGIAFHF